MRNVSMLAVVAAAFMLLAGTSSAASLPGFAAPRVFTAGQTLGALAVADFDGTGRLGFAVADQASPFTCTVNRLQSSPHGTPYASRTYVTDTFNLSAVIDDMAAGPIGDDGFPDLVLASGGGLVYAFNEWGFAGTAFAWAPGTPMTAGAGITLDHVRIADWNNDLAMDLIATGHDAGGNGVLAIFLGISNGPGHAGSGQFLPAVVTTLAHPVYGLCVRDVTHDGYDDVAVVYRDDDAVGVLTNPGDGTATAVNEATVSLPFHPEAVTFGILANAPGRPFLPDIIIAGSGRSADGTSNDTQIAVAQNLSVDESQTATFQAVTTFPFQGVAGADALLATDVAAVDADPTDGDVRVTIAFVNSVTDSVTVMSLSPTLSGTTVSSWGRPTTEDVPCGGSPLRVAFLDADGDNLADIVTANGAGHGVNVMIGGSAPASPDLTPATGLALTANGKKAKPAGFADGAACVFSCTNTDTAVAGALIRVQASETPGSEPSWTDLPGGGVMALDAKTGKWLLHQSQFSVGTGQFFRTATYAAGYVDGISHAAPPTTDPARYIGPYDVLPGPAKLSLTVVLQREGAGGRTVHRGESALVQFVYRNDGETQADKVYVAALVPAGCTVTNAGGGVVTPGKGNALALVSWGPLTLSPHSGDVKEFEMSVGASVAVGGTLKATGSVVGVQISGKKITKVAAVLAGSNVLSVESEFGVAFHSDVPSAHVGDSFAVRIDVANRTTYAMQNVTFVEHLTPDENFDLGGYDAANGAYIPGVSATVNAAHDTITWTFASLAPNETRQVLLELQVRYDHAPSGSIPLAGYTLSGTQQGGTLTVSGDAKPAAVNVPIDGPAATAPKLALREGVDTGHFYTASPYWGQVDFAYPGDTMQYVLFYRNVGDADAQGCTLHATVPPGTDLVPGSFQLDGVTLAADPVSGANIVYRLDTIPSISSDGLLHLFAFTVRIRAPGAVGAANPGDVVATQFASITSDSFAQPIYMNPVQLKVLVATPAQFDVRKTVTHSGLALNESMTITYTITNSGTLDAAGATAAFGWPKYEKCLSATLDGAAVTGTTGKSVCTYPIGDIAGGKFKTFAVTVQLVSVPPPTFVIVNTLDLAGTAKSFEKSTTTVNPSSHDDEFTNVCDKSRACVFIAMAANSITGLTSSTDYVIVVGNTSDQAATGVTVTALLPKGTKVNVDKPATPGMKIDSKKATLSWSVANLPPHEVKSFLLSLLQDGSLSIGDAIVQEAAVTASNAEAKVSGRIPVTVISDQDAYSDLVPATALYAGGISYTGGNPGIDAALAALDAATVDVQIRGADFTLLSGGVVIIPLGADKALALGPDAWVNPLDSAAHLEPNDGSSHSVNDAFAIVSGATSSITTYVLGQTFTTVREALDGLSALVKSKSASVVSNGGGNLVDETGVHLVANRPGALVSPVAFLDATGIVSQGAGNIVASGAGNIVASGAGNIVASGAGNLTAAGSASVASLMPSMLVMSGGGSIVNTNGSNIVSQGAGNVIAAGAGGIVSQGAGNAVIVNGSGIVSQGAGNFVGKGGGN